MTDPWRLNNPKRSTKDPFRILKSLKRSLRIQRISFRSLNNPSDSLKNLLRIISSFKESHTILQGLTRIPNDPEGFLEDPEPIPTRLFLLRLNRLPNSVKNCKNRKTPNRICTITSELESGTVQSFPVDARRRRPLHAKPSPLLFFYDFIIH